MKFVNEVRDQLTNHWLGNEFRVLDEKGNEYRATLLESDGDITYMKVEILHEVPSS